MSRAVGLDLGSRFLKVVSLSGSARSFKVHRVVVKEMPTGPEATEEAKAAVVREAFAEGRFGKDDVCAAFDAGLTVFREITVPFTDDAKIEQVVRFEAENHLHGRAIEDVVVNWVKLGETKEGSQLLVLAAPKEALAGRLALLRRAGIEPASVDLDATALYGACHAAKVFEEHPDVVILEVGARTTNLLVVSEGNLRAVRSFLVGAETVALGLQQDLALPAGEAQERAFAGGSSGDLLVPDPSAASASDDVRKSVPELEKDAASARRAEFVRKLAREIQRTATHVRAAKAPDRLLLAGGGALLPDLAASLQEALGLQVEPLGILGRLGYRSGSATPEFEDAACATAVGCGLRLLGADPLGVELRKEEFAPSNLFDVVRTPLAIAVTLLVAGLVFFAVSLKEIGDREHTRHNLGAAQKAAGILEDVETAYWRDVKFMTGDQPKDKAKKERQAIPSDENYLNSVRNFLLRRYRELESELGLSRDVPPIESATEVWTEVHKALDSLPRTELGYVKISKLQASQGQVVVSIELDNVEVSDRIEKALAQSEYFKRRAKNPGKVVQRGNFGLDPQSKRYKGSFTVDFADPS